MEGEPALVLRTDGKTYSPPSFLQGGAHVAKARVGKSCEFLFLAFFCKNRYHCGFKCIQLLPLIWRRKRLIQCGAESGFCFALAQPGWLAGGAGGSVGGRSLSGWVRLLRRGVSSQGCIQPLQTSLPLPPPPPHCLRHPLHGADRPALEDSGLRETFRELLFLAGPELGTP